MSRQPSGSIRSYRGMDNSDDDLLPVSSKPKPSQTKPDASNTSATAGSSNIIKVFEANAFKTINGQYQLQGRFGLALLTSTAASKLEFKLLVYASGNVIVTQVLITTALQVTVSNKVYASLCDTFNQNWSFLFDNVEKVEDFVQHITIAQFRTSECKCVTYNDVTVGEGENLAVGDSAEIKYSGWLLMPNGSLGTLFESNESSGASLRIKMGKGKPLKAWDEGLINMQCGGKRFLAVPPKKAYGNKGLPPKVPSLSNIFFEVEILRIRKYSTKESRSLSSQLDLAASLNPMTELQDDDAPLPLIPELKDEPTPVSTKISTELITEKIPNENPSKEKILLRMKHLGQSMLPPQKILSHESDNGEDIDSNKESITSTVQSAPTQAQTPPLKHFQPIAELPQQSGIVYQIQPNVVSAPQNYPVAHYQNPQSIMPSGPSNQLAQYSSVRPGVINVLSQQPVSDTQFQQQSNIPTMNSTSQSDQMHTAMLVNETRQHNTEMRIAISKLQDRVDNVLNVVKDQQLNENRSIATSIVPSMETTVLLQNLTRIIQENEHLKVEMMQKSEKIEQQHMKISALLAKNQQFLEQNNQSIERTSQTITESASQSQAKVLLLEEQKLKLVQDLSTRTAEIYDLQVHLDEYKKEAVKSLRNLTSNVEQKDLLQTENDTLKLKNNDLHREIAMLKDQIMESKQSRRLLEQTNENYKHKEIDIEQEHSVSIKTFKEKISRLEEDKIKYMNDFDHFKQQSEKEIEDLREKLRKERAAAYSDTSLKQNIIEEEITERWKKRCDQLVRAESDKYERKLSELTEDKNRVEADLQATTTKLGNFKSQTIEMKQNLMEEVNRLNFEIEELTEKLQLSVKSAQMAAVSVANKEAVKTAETTDQIRSIMNNVFRTLRQKISVDKRYEGSKVHQIAMSIIRKTTLQMTGELSSESSEISESESETESETSDHANIKDGFNDHTNKDISFINKEIEEQHHHSTVEKEPLQNNNINLESKRDSEVNEDQHLTQSVSENISSDPVIDTNKNSQVTKSNMLQSEDAPDTDSDFSDEIENEIIVASSENKDVEDDLDVVQAKLNSESFPQNLEKTNESLESNKINSASQSTFISETPKDDLDVVQTKLNSESFPQNLEKTTESSESNNINSASQSTFISETPTKPVESSRVNLIPKAATTEIIPNLFSDSDDEDLFATKPTKILSKPDTTTKTTDESNTESKNVKPLFADDDDMAWLNS